MLSTTWVVWKLAISTPSSTREQPHRPRMTWHCRVGIRQQPPPVPEKHWSHLQLSALLCWPMDSNPGFPLLRLRLPFRLLPFRCLLCVRRLLRFYMSIKMSLTLKSPCPCAAFPVDDRNPSTCWQTLTRHHQTYCVEGDTQSYPRAE